jgi:hypothetical protein
LAGSPASTCIRTFFMRQSVIGEPPNLIQDVTAKSAEMGRSMPFITPNHTGSQSSQCWQALGDEACAAPGQLPVYPTIRSDVATKLPRRPFRANQTLISRSCTLVNVTRPGGNNSSGAALRPSRHRRHTAMRIKNECSARESRRRSTRRHILRRSRHSFGPARRLVLVSVRHEARTW